MDTGTYTLVLSIAGALIVLLLAIAGWLVKDRLRKAEKKEDTLEKRLSAGSETMHRIQIALEKMQSAQVEASAKLLSLAQFDEYRRDHNADHKDVDQRMERLCEGQEELRIEINGMGERIEGKLSTMANLLASKVEVA